MEIRKPKFNVGDKVIDKRGYVGTVVSVHSMEFLQDRQDKQQTYQEPQQNFGIDDSDLPF